MSGWDDSDESDLEGKLEAQLREKEKQQRRQERGEDESDEEEDEPKASSKPPQASDDDDEWENWDDDENAIEEKLKAQLKEKEKQKKREAGEDTDSEEEEDVKKEEPKPKAAPKKKGPTMKAEEEKPKVDPDQIPLKDPQAEKERLRKLEEDRDARLAADLFAGVKKADSLLEKEKREKDELAAAKKAAAKPKVVTVDEFESLQLTSSADVDSLCAKCLDKLEASTLHKGGPQRFLTNLIKKLEDSFDMADLENLEKSLAQIVKDKKATKANASLSKENKAATKINKNTKFNKESEWEDIYGGGDDDEDWTQEEWDAWYAQQEAKGAKWS